MLQIFSTSCKFLMETFYFLFDKEIWLIMKVYLFFLLVFNTKKVKYVVICCNCLFDFYLLEFNKNPDLLLVPRKNMQKIFKLRNKWYCDGTWHQEKWFKLRYDHIFHACFKCIYTVSRFIKLQRYDFVHQLLNRNCDRIQFDQEVLNFQVLITVFK